MKVIVYSKVNCVQCDATKRWLKKNDIPFEEESLTPELIEEFKVEGFMSAPVVKTDVETWAGFRISKLDALVKEYKSEQVHKNES